MDGILSNPSTLDPQDIEEEVGPGDEEIVDGLDEDGEDIKESFSENTGDNYFPAETVSEVKLENQSMPIPVPVNVTVGKHDIQRPQSSSHQNSLKTPKRPRRVRTRRANFPLEKLMEQFLEQSAQAEENFYRVEEQRLQADDRRREAEHSREMHMLQMLGQMFSNISSTRPGVGVPSATPACAQGQPGHIRNTSQSDLLNPHSQDAQHLGSNFLCNFGCVFTFCFADILFIHFLRK